MVYSQKNCLPLKSRSKKGHSEVNAPHTKPTDEMRCGHISFTGYPNHDDGHVDDWVQNARPTKTILSLFRCGEGTSVVLERDTTAQRNLNSWSCTQPARSGNCCTPLAARSHVNDRYFLGSLGFQHKDFATEFGEESRPKRQYGCPLTLACSQTESARDSSSAVKVPCSAPHVSMKRDGGFATPILFGHSPFPQPQTWPSVG